MEVLFTSPVKDYLIEDLHHEFSNVNFVFSNIKDEEALKNAEIIVT